MREKVYVVGGFQEIFELCELCGLDVLGYFDYAPIEHQNEYPWLGKDESAKGLFELNNGVSRVVISPDKPIVRRKLCEYYRGIGYQIASLISPKAHISKSAVISEGCIIQSFCNVSANVKLGICVKLNTSANVMHDAVVENFATIAPGATILGFVHIGEGSYIGSGATIIERHRVGQDSVVGAGAVVTKDIDEGVVVAGVPAKPIKNG